VPFLRFALKVAVGVLATVGVIFIALETFALLFAPHCMLNSAAQATSPTGQYFALYEQRVCQKPENSRSEVLMGKRGERERNVIVEIQGTTQVGLTWAGPSELVVSYPIGSTVKQYGPYDGWPRVTLRQLEPQ